ncbi:MAG: DNRLRE domain-containing protein [Nitrospiraceae bacterium]|nr:DNRLRE domain-containing protein [Nitrospiraceae bacterium]
MKKYPLLRITKIWASCISLLALAFLASCGGGGGGGPAPITGPGFVGLDDTTNKTAPLLVVTYTDSSGTVTVNILSDLSSDGDIAFDPVTNTYTVTQSPSEVFFGEDSSSADLPEYRAFLTFPLASIPSDATIDSATLEVFVDEADFASTIPTFVDMIQYPVGALSAADFNASLVTSTSYRAIDFFSSDTGNFVDIDVTGLMQEAQVPPALADLQIRFGLQSLLAGLVRGTAVQAKRSVHSQPRSLDTLKRERNSAGRSTPGQRGAPVSNSE